MTNDEIDRAVAAIKDIVKIGVQFYRPLALAEPLISAFISFEAMKLKHGIASGAIVPDGHGGFVPKTNSRFDPKTGNFV